MERDNEYKHAIGTFETRTQAQEALSELRDAGFNMDKVSVVSKNATTEEDYSGAESKPTSEQAKGGAKAGAKAGAATGGVIGLIGGLSVLAIPGVGALAEIGIVLANTVLGGGIGAAGGGIIGALIGWGVPENDAKHYNDLLSSGTYLILLEGTDADVSAAEAILQKNRIQNWGVYGSPVGYQQGYPGSTARGVI